MAVRLSLVACLLATAAFAGCAVRAAQEETFNAKEAVEAAWDVVRPLDPAAQLLAVSASEGPQWRMEHGKDLASADETGGDGARGDGLTGSWVSLFSAQGALLQVRTYADGREPVLHWDRESQKPGEWRPHNAPAKGNQGPSTTDAGSWSVDSDAAIAAVMALPEFQAHVAESPAGGFAYRFLPYSAANTLYSFDFSLGGEPEYEAIGWAVWGNVWVVTHLDAEAITRGEAPTVATAGVDAATGKVVGLTIHVPRVPQVVLEVSESFSDPVVPSGLTPEPHAVPFTVPAHSSRLAGMLFCFSADWVVSVDDVRCELVDPSGKVAYAARDPFAGQGPPLDIKDPAAGTWTLRVSHDQPLPRSIDVHAMLAATVPLYFRPTTEGTA